MFPLFCSTLNPNRGWVETLFYEALTPTFPSHVNSQDLTAHIYHHQPGCDLPFLDKQSSEPLRYLNYLSPYVRNVIEYVLRQDPRIPLHLKDVVERTYFSQHALLSHIRRYLLFKRDHTYVKWVRI